MSLILSTSSFPATLPKRKKRILERYDIEKTKLRTLSARLISGELHTIIITPT